MSLQFIFGNSGSGKSDFLYDSVLKQAKENKEQQFLIIVPEQFTMQTQRELVERQKQHAIMNVDVLSFARLAYRVFDDLGKQNVVVLEETGKNLVLRKVAEQKKAELKVLGANMNKMGYVGEVKSLISELMQYNVRPDALAEFLEREPLGEGLRLKMQDVLTMYQGFTEYLKGRYITAEEVLELLYDVAEESELLRNSVIVLDEFTGFTPIQNRLMEKLLVLAKKVSVSVTMDVREDFYQCRGVHELFAMSKKTVASLLKVAELCKVPVEEPLVLPTGKQRRYANAADLYFMEQNLFRPGAGSYRYKASEQSMQHIRITSLKNPREELKFAAREIVRLTRENGYRYRDIAVVTGDVQQYGNYVPEIFEQYHIPYFIDQTKNILFHPFIECIRAILEMIEYDFSYESVFRFLRCGLAAKVVTEAKNSDKEPDPAATEDLTQQPETGSHGLTEQEIDRLENYVLARGIRGASRWSRPWTFVMPDGTLEDMARLNEIREAVYENFKPLLEAFRGKDNTVSTQTYELYSLIRRLNMEQLLKERGNFFEAHGNQARAKEYDQIYKIVMDLLDKVTSLLGDETMTVREYSDILDAGFEAAKVGIIPPGNDTVTVGDIERTRLNHVKILFFVGVNDGVVPKAGNQGGIISQFEREKMAEYHLELAPGAREKVFIQKFYLYLNMTKPSERLDAVQFQLGEDEKMRLRGRIDRVDTYETDDKVYVKIIDYKSGNTTFSLLNFYYGLQLQLVVYMNAALELTKKKYKGKDTEPAGIFYYHITDPMVDADGQESEEEIRRSILEQLKVGGLVNEDPEIYGAMDTDFSGTSTVIPVALKADGSLKATSKTASTYEFGLMSHYVRKKIEHVGKEIFAGNVAVKPYLLGDRSGCDYCPYHTICGFDVRMPGFSYQQFEKFDSSEEILAHIREEIGEPGKNPDGE